MERELLRPAQRGRPRDMSPPDKMLNRSEREPFQPPPGWIISEW